MIFKTFLTLTTLMTPFVGDLFSMEVEVDAAGTTWPDTTKPFYKHYGNSVQDDDASSTSGSVGSESDSVTSFADFDDGASLGGVGEKKDIMTASVHALVEPQKPFLLFTPICMPLTDEPDVPVLSLGDARVKRFSLHVLPKFKGVLLAPGSLEITLQVTSGESTFKYRVGHRTDEQVIEISSPGEDDGDADGGLKFPLTARLKVAYRPSQDSYRQSKQITIYESFPITEPENKAVGFLRFTVKKPSYVTEFKLHTKYKDKR